ncbi:MAG: hypothetical protein O0X93_05985, partial [Methanocorpusculum sp.]|nr:hypothetical protein [Methanocorpusculum sp.]
KSQIKSLEDSTPKNFPLNILPNLIQKYAESSRILHQKYFTDQRSPEQKSQKEKENHKQSTTNTKH